MINYSFIIPHKNSTELLNRLINTIPDRDDIEIIIIDDNSDLSEYEKNKFPGLDKPNTKIIFDKENKGAGHARNIGIKNAQGKWLLFADADDYYNNDFINVLDSKIESNLDILYFNVRINFKWRFLLAEKYKEYFNGNGNVNDIKYIWNPWNKVFSRNFIIRNDLWFEEIPVGNDAMFCLRASYNAKNIKIINDQLYTYTNDNTNSITFKSMTLQRKLDYLKINLKINKFFRYIHEENRCFLLISPRILYIILRTYGPNGLIKYIYCFIHSKTLIQEIQFWLKK